MFILCTGMIVIDDTSIVEAPVAQPPAAIAPATDTVMDPFGLDAPKPLLTIREVSALKVLNWH